MGGNGGLHYQGMANPANRQISDKIAKIALFNPCTEFKNFLGQMTSFEVLSLVNFTHKVPLAPYMRLFSWKKVDK